MILRVPRGLLINEAAYNIEEIKGLFLSYQIQLFVEKNVVKFLFLNAEKGRKKVFSFHRYNNNFCKGGAFQVDDYGTIKFNHKLTVFLDNKTVVPAYMESNKYNYSVSACGKKHLLTPGYIDFISKPYEHTSNVIEVHQADFDFLWENDCFYVLVGKNKVKLTTVVGLTTLKGPDVKVYLPYFVSWSRDSLGRVKLKYSLTIQGLL